MHESNENASLTFLNKFLLRNQTPQPTPAVSAITNITVHILTNGDTAAISEHAGSNVHGHQLLEQKFCGVWDVNLCDTRAILAGSALESLIFEITTREKLAI
jgi:hypothetical protein